LAFVFSTLSPSLSLLSTFHPHYPFALAFEKNFVRYQGCPYEIKGLVFIVKIGP